MQPLEESIRVCVISIINQQHVSRFEDSEMRQGTFYTNAVIPTSCVRKEDGRR